MQESGLGQEHNDEPAAQQVDLLLAQRPPLDRQVARELLVVGLSKA